MRLRALRPALRTDNTANTSALCEAMVGLGRRYRKLAYLSFNDGFGAAILSEGDLQRGAYGNAGEIGMLFTPDDAPVRPVLGLLLAHLRRAGRDTPAIGAVCLPLRALAF